MTARAPGVSDRLSSLESLTKKSGWSVVLRGVIAVVFGIIALRSPTAVAKAFVIVFAVYAFADGILDFVFASQLGKAGQRWGWYVFEGLVSIALGVIALAFPAITLLALVMLIGIRAIIMGVVELVAAFSWDAADHRWMMGITGVLSIMLGILLLGAPMTGGLALLWMIGVYAIIFGIMLFGLGLRMLSVERDVHRLQHRDMAPTT